MFRRSGNLFCRWSALAILALTTCAPSAVAQTPENCRQSMDILTEQISSLISYAQTRPIAVATLRAKLIEAQGALEQTRKCRSTVTESQLTPRQQTEETRPSRRPSPAEMMEKTLTTHGRMTVPEADDQAATPSGTKIARAQRLIDDLSLSIGPSRVDDQAIERAVKRFLGTP